MSRTQLWRIVLHTLQINCNSFLQNNLEEERITRNELQLICNVCKTILHNCVLDILGLIRELKHSNWNARHYRLTSNGSLFLGHTVFDVTIEIIKLEILEACDLLKGF